MNSSYQIPLSDNPNYKTLMEHYIRVKYVDRWFVTDSNIPGTKEGYILKQGSQMSIKIWKKNT